MPTEAPETRASAPPPCGSRPGRSSLNPRASRGRLLRRRTWRDQCCGRPERGSCSRLVHFGGGGGRIRTGGPQIATQVPCHLATPPFRNSVRPGRAVGFQPLRTRPRNVVAFFPRFSGRLRIVRHRRFSSMARSHRGPCFPGATAPTSTKPQHLAVCKPQDHNRSWVRLGVVGELPVHEPMGYQPYLVPSGGPGFRSAPRTH